jgi:hypothetical protein|tara:strand:- start:820 stop:1164 length:345 start_codon:yes stop_codon:yes gene_type:complete
MTTIRSRKAKGRNLQNLVVAKLLEKAPELELEDIKGAIMGEQGVDIKLSPRAHLKYPLKIECKNQEKFKGIYDVYSQAEGHKGKGEPVVILKMNRKRPLVLIDLDFFIDFYKGG